MVMLIFLYIVILAYDLPKLKKRNKKTVVIYISLLVIALYQSISFAFDLEWPFLHTAIDALLGEPTRRIVEFLEVSPS